METTLCSLRETARQLRVPMRWLRDEAQAGRVPSLKAGSRFVFHTDAVKAALVERAKRPAEGGER